MKNMLISFVTVAMVTSVLMACGDKNEESGSGQTCAQYCQEMEQACVPVCSQRANADFGNLNGGSTPYLRRVTPDGEGGGSSPGVTSDGTDGSSTHRGNVCDSLVDSEDENSYFHQYDCCCVSMQRG